MKIKEVIVVEGKADTAKIKQAVKADTIETNGSAIHPFTIEQIRHAQEKRGIIIFTDPDYPGERIRQIIDQAVSGCKHAFLTRREARAKHPKNNSLGIEHASIASIQHALKSVYEPASGEIFPMIEKNVLIDFGLIGGQGASKRRKRLGELLKIGHVNGKQLQKRLTMFQITEDQLFEALQVLEREEKNA